MLKRYARSLFYLLLIISTIFSFLSGNLLVGITLAVIYYLLFGFVMFAFFISIFGDNKKGHLLISLTFPYLLLKPERAYYYWLKSSFIAANKKDYGKALGLSKKVIEENLSTDNDRSLFNSYLACLYHDLKEYNQSEIYLKKAKEIPHKEMINEYYNKLESDFIEDRTVSN